MALKFNCVLKTILFCHEIAVIHQVKTFLHILAKMRKSKLIRWEQKNIVTLKRKIYDRKVISLQI